VLGFDRQFSGNPRTESHELPWLSSCKTLLTPPTEIKTTSNLIRSVVDGYETNGSSRSVLSIGDLAS
jgi:hypothetical protein